MLGRKVLSDKYVTKLYNIFEKKNWKIWEEGDSSVFDRFCERLVELESDEERDLIIELTNEFLWIQSNMYEEYLLRAFKNLFKSEKWNPEKEKSIYICPLLPPRDFGKQKSSTHMLYLCQGILLRTYSEFQEKQVRICETPERLKEHADKIGALILIDDFIGSGETALECLEYLNFVNVKTYIVALVAQEEGINNISSEGISVFTAVSRKKAITDVYPEEEAKEKIKKMIKISKQLQAPKGMQLGYASTESLVAMIKTPNNTFPVYWCECKENSHAPFVRKGNIKVIGSEKKCENQQNF